MDNDDIQYYVRRHYDKYTHLIRVVSDEVYALILSDDFNACHGIHKDYPHTLKKGDEYRYNVVELKRALVGSSERYKKISKEDYFKFRIAGKVYDGSST